MIGTSHVADRPREGGDPFTAKRSAADGERENRFYGARRAPQQHGAAGVQILRHRRRRPRLMPGPAREWGRGWRALSQCLPFGRDGRQCFPERDTVDGRPD